MASPIAKLYIPSQLSSNRYKYFLKDDIIYVLKTNAQDEPCTTDNYNNTYCYLYRVYTKYNYLYVRQQNQVNRDYFYTQMQDYEIRYNQLSADWWNRVDMPYIFIIFLILFIFCIHLPYKILSRLFGRWLKV